MTFIFMFIKISVRRVTETTHFREAPRILFHVLIGPIEQYEFGPPVPTLGPSESITALVARKVRWYGSCASLCSHLIR